MIKSDFPTLSDEQIANNIDVIDEYYTQNLSYVTLSEIANNQKAIQAKVSTNKHNLMSRSLNDFIACAVDNIVLIFGYNPVKALTAATIGNDQAETTATNYYNSANGFTIGAVHTAKNAYKHMAWNALLAQNYFTISSKANRLKFAKDFTDRHEFCGTNPDDSKEMDFHNNAIGRQVWDANTSYRRVAGVTVGLNTLSNTALKSKLRERIDRRSCFIVKINENRFPENLITNNKGIPEIKNKILATDNTRPVYFVGPIIESTVYWYRVFLRYDFVPCGPDDNPEEGEDTGEGGVILCERAIYTNVRREITPCYQL
jgi:hypothetical protein